VLRRAASVFLAWWPVIAPIYRLTHASTGAAGFYARPSVSALILKYSALVFPSRMAVVLLAFGLLASVAWLPGGAGARPAERKTVAKGNLDVAAFGALTMPLIVFLFAALVTRSFNSRYFLAAPLGLCLMAGVAMMRIRFANAISAVLIVLCAGLFVYSTALIRRDTRLTLLSRIAEPLPILIPDAGDFFELIESAPPAIRERLVYSRMPQGVPSPDPEPQLVADNWKRLRSDLPVVAGGGFSSRQTPGSMYCVTGGPREV